MFAAGTFYVDAVLTSMARHYQPNPALYIARTLAPILPVPDRSALYPIFSREAFRMPQNSRLDRAGEANTITGSLATRPYRCEGHGLADVQTVVERQEFRWLTPEQQRNEAVFVIQRQLANEHEAKVRDLYTTATNYASTHVLDINTNSVAWDATTGDVNPIADFTDAADLIILNTAQLPNVLWFNQQGWRALIDSLPFRQRFFPFFNGQINAAMVASLLDFPVQVVIGRAPINDANPGGADSMVYLWNQDTDGADLGPLCGLAYINNAPSIYNPSTAHTFSWELAGSMGGFISGSWMVPGVGGVLGAEKVESDWFYDPHLVGVEAGEVISAVLLTDLLT